MKKQRRKMRPGGGAKKGGSYERKLARALSTWWYGDPNYLWRRPGSGHRVNMSNRHTGDIVPIADTGSLPHPWLFHVEAKCYAKSRLKLGCLLWPKRNPIRKIWDKAVAERRKDLVPLLILKANNTDPVGVMYEKDLEDLLHGYSSTPHRRPNASRYYLDVYVNWTTRKGRVIIFPWLEIQKLERPKK